MDQFRPTPPNSTPLTPLTFLDRCATIYGDCTSIVYGNTTYKWSETRRRCLQVASSITKLGIRHQQVVSVIAPNIPALYELYFAIPFAGAVINSINTRLDARTVSVILTHSESKLLFVDQHSVSLILDALSMFSSNTHKPMLVLITDDGSPVKSNSFKCSYDSMVENGDPGFDWVRPHSEWDPITLNYTSGTTSAPKGVVHCHRGMFLMAVDSLIEWSVPKQPVYLWTLPIFHANGWSYTWGTAAVGATNVCLRKFDAGVIYDLIDKHGVTHMCGAPVVLNMLWNAPDVKGLKNPVKIMTAGAPPPAAIKDRSKDVIISGGENLSSVEVESVLYTHTAVNEAAVVAREDEYWGETPCAFVSLKAQMVGKVTEKDVTEYCKGKLPGYMVPKTVVFKEELPKTSTGKIQKFVLREMAKTMGPIRKSRM
ncbi:hypothetical protein E3N88_12203 [Mikania micrantha]|uniref:Uncharacterized protein n=1 Tax=Mikania micrantha TaxID=192012 RepID=A0A5N6P4U6_9ASTR|nr:hypothetical protein E3N88_12203 [Mikania micrantha]